jgi:hypothetical protein
MPPTPPPTPDDDPLAAFELPPDVMSSTLEHAISDDAGAAHEHGHAVAAALQKALKGSTVEYGFPGIVMAYLPSGAIARCGGPALGWRVEIQRTVGGEPDTIDVEGAERELDPKAIGKALAKVLKGR